MFTSMTSASKPHHVVDADGVTLGYTHFGMLAAARWIRAQVPLLRIHMKLVDQSFPSRDAGLHALRHAGAPRWIRAQVLVSQQEIRTVFYNLHRLCVSRGYTRCGMLLAAR